MRDKAAVEVQRRFEMLGFIEISAQLGSGYQVVVSDDKINLRFYTKSGRLTFTLDLAKDIDVLTGNMVAYTATWNGIYQIHDVQIDGIGTKMLETRILDIDYLSDDDKVFDEFRKAIINDLEILRLSKKAEATQHYQSLIARYGLWYGFAPASEVWAARQALNKLHSVHRKYSLLPGKFTPPIKAFEQLVTISEKALKKAK